MRPAHAGLMVAVHGDSTPWYFAQASRIQRKLDLNLVFARVRLFRPLC
jgi:hypothetical protein